MSEQPRPTVSARLIGLIDRRLVSTNRRTERVLLAIAAAAFVIGAVWAWGEVGSDITVGWAWILGNALIGVPATVMLNAIEFRHGAALVGAAPTMAEATEVSVLGSAANLLPLPGAALVRIRALRQGGSDYGGATRVTAAIGVLFVAVAATVAAVAASSLTADLLIWVFVAIAGAGLVIFAVLLRSTPVTPTPGWIARIVLIELTALTLIGGRFALSLQAIGQFPTGVALALMAAAGPLATATGILPGGVGLREGLAAFLAGQAGLAAASGFLAVALDRVVELVVTGIVAGGLVLRQSSRAQTHDDRPTPE